MMLVFEKCLQQNPHEDTYSHYYVAGGAEHTWKELAKSFAKALHRNGKIASPMAKQVPLEKAGFMAG